MELPGEFDDKTQDEILWEAVSFENRLVDGVTITSCAVTADVSADSAIADPNPSAILSGGAIKNSTAFNVKIGKPAIIVTVPAGVAVLQLVTDGVPGCTYLLTYTAVLSNGETIERRMLLFVLPPQTR